MVQVIASALEPELNAFERERAVSKPPDTLDAWELYQRALWYMWTFEKENINTALDLFKRSTEADPKFAPAYAYYAYWFVGQDRETPYHMGRMFWLAWDRVMRSKANRWAYIAVYGAREAEGTDYETDIIDFVQKVYPYLLTDSMNNKVYKQ